MCRLHVQLRMHVCGDIVPIIALGGVALTESQSVINEDVTITKLGMYMVTQ